MSTNLIASPEFLPISPESLEIANTYMACMDINSTSEQLGLPINTVVEYISKPEVQRYITEVFLNSGYRNRFKLGALLDKIIDKKIAELEEADITSSKDILEILTLAHKMRMEEIAAETKREEARNGKIKRQTNIQVNNNENGSAKRSIFEELIGDISEIGK